MKKLLLTSAAVALTTGAANAVVLHTDTDQFGFSGTEISGTLSTDGYTPLPGETITSVKWTLTGLIGGTSAITIDNDSDQEETGSVDTVARFNFDSLDFLTPANPDFTVVASTGSVTLAADDGDGSGPADGGPDQGTFAVSGSDMIMNTILGPALLGGASVDFFTQTGLSSFFAGGNADIQQLTQAQVQLEVVYEGTREMGEIPLPASLPLLLAGMGGLGFLGWRRAKKG
jgi:hypothetical protein